MAKKDIEYIDATEPIYHFQTEPSEKDSDNPRSLCHTCRQDKPQMVYDYLHDAPELVDESPYVEVQFKNTRKGYYLNTDHLDLHKGDIVAVEGNPGHDIGEVTLTGYLVRLQMKKVGFHFDAPEAQRKVFRLARENDMERYREAKAREQETMLRSRQIAEGLGLEMKIGDVEFQGDGLKAIFYYIADGRVDFRQLIKDLAAAFKIRIEMKQIGARQEAGRIGGIGPCGRELCCAKWQTRFQSVGTAAARFQDLSLNPQKLAGQCAKLKCCLNYEVDCYMEAAKEVPGKDIVLYTQDSEYHLFKVDTLARLCTYSTGKEGGFNLVTISAQRAFDVYHMNKRGEKPESLSLSDDEEDDIPEFTDGVGDEALNRFDRAKKKKKSRNKNRNNDKPKQGNQPQNEGQNQPEKNEAQNRQEKGEGQNRPDRGDRRDRRDRRDHNRGGNKDGGNGGANAANSGNKPNGVQQPQQ